MIEQLARLIEDSFEGYGRIETGAAPLFRKQDTGEREISLVFGFGADDPREMIIVRIRPFYGTIDDPL